MNVVNVSNDDGRACAQLMAFLKVGRWDLSGDEAEKLIQVKRWVAAMAQNMAKELGPKPAASETAMKVKGMGPLSGSQSKRNRKK